MDLSTACSGGMVVNEHNKDALPKHDFEWDSDN
jgi:hypothetical protein